MINGPKPEKEVSTQSQESHEITEITVDKKEDKVVAKAAKTQLPQQHKKKHRRLGKRRTPKGAE